MKGPGGRTGRPARSAAERLRARRLLAKTCSTIGWSVGWRTVRGALGSLVPVRLLQECLSVAKPLHEAHRRRRIEQRRLHVTVLAANVIWHQDAAHLGRTAEEEVQGEVVKDAAVPDVLAASVGPAVTAKDAIANVEASIAATGSAPLVISTDNGPAYTSKAYKACLVKHRIVHLRNLPHTPQHNARAERAIRDVKEESGLGRGVHLASVDEAADRVAAACGRLALRAQITAEPAPLPVLYTAEHRDGFYEAVCRRIAGAVQCDSNDRAWRMAEREAIFAELAARGLIERTRGGEPMPATKAEIKS
jgi:transposase InsO family protein